MESLLQPGRQFRPGEIIDELQGDLDVPEQPVAGGGFANIYQGFWTDKHGARTEVAIKEIRPLVPNANQNAAEAEELQRKRIGRELFIWSQTKHPHLQPLLGYQSQPRPRLICPWARHGNLTNYLQNNPGLSRFEKLLLIYQTGLGLCHLHSQSPPICHADIKPENVLINDACEAALCDFGISRILQDSKSGFTTSATAKGTMAYMAPELFLEEKRSLSSDVYAFGGLILKVMTGKAPFYSSTNQDFVFAQVVKGQTPDPQAYPELPITDPLWKLMRRCWAQAPDARPTMQDVLAELSMHIQSAGAQPSSSHLLLASANAVSTSDHTVTLQPKHRKQPEHALLVGAVLGIMQFWLEAIPVLMYVWRLIGFGRLPDAETIDNIHSESSSTANLTQTSITASTATAAGTTSSSQIIGSTVEMAAVVGKVLERVEVKLPATASIAGYVEALVNLGRGLIRTTQTSDGDTEGLRSLVLGTWMLAGLMEDLQDKVKTQMDDLSGIINGIQRELEGLREAVIAQRWFYREESSKKAAEKVLEEIEFLLRLDAQKFVSEAISIKIQGERRQLLSAFGDGRHGVQGNTIEDALCLPGTRVEVLEEIDTWVRSSSSNDRALWIRGMAGRGKSTIATTVVRRWKHRASCAIFHFRRGQNDLDSKILCSLAKQLGNSMVAKVRDAMMESVCRHPDVAEERLDEQFKILVASALASLESDDLPILLVIDGLDECENAGYVVEFLKLIDRHSSSIPTSVKFLFTSRPETDITRAFETKPWRVANLDTLGAIRDDLKIFVQHGCEIIRAEHKLPKEWPTSEEVAQLVEMSQGLFQWARTAIAYVGKRAPKSRLHDLLSRPSAWNGLGDLYHQILEHAFANLESESQELLRQMIAVLVIAPHPISLHVIASLLVENVALSGLDPESSARQLQDETLGDLNSLILIPHSTTEPVHLLHTSIRDFFLNKNRCEGRVYQIDIPQQHKEMAKMCLRFMVINLKQNICNITSLSTSNTEAQEAAEKRVFPALRYSCRAWATHLTEGVQDAQSVVGDSNAVRDDFATLSQEKILCWLEVMSHLGVIVEAINISRRVHRWLSMTSHKLNDTNNFISLWLDILRFTMMFLEPMSFSPAHIYASALHHCPENTQLWKYYGAQAKVQPLRSTKSSTWPADIWARVINHSIKAVAVSPNGKIVASGSDDHMIRFWDAQSGILLREPLVGHTVSVEAVAFSPDGSILASASGDSTIRLWDAHKGTPLRSPLKGHVGIVNSIAFSPDGTILASGSSDATARFWDIQTATALREPLKGHTNPILSLAFSPNGTALASGSSDGTIRLWDVQTGSPLQGECQHDHYPVFSVAFSPDGRTLASGSRDHGVRLWDVGSGKPRLQNLLRGHTDWVRSVAFAPDGKTLASASDDKSIRLWDVGSGELVRPPLMGQHGWIYSVVFTPDGRTLASGSGGGAVQLWDVVGGTPPTNSAAGHANSITAIAFSPDGKTVASSDNDTIRLWDVQSGAQFGDPLEGHTRMINSIAFSPDGGLLASGSSDTTVRLWEVQTGTQLHGPLVGHKDWVRCVAFSPNGKTIASASDDFGIRLWDVHSGAMLRGELEGHSHFVYCITFSPDGKVLASGSEDQKVCLWDIESGSLLRDPLKGHSSRVYAVAFSPDGRTLASGSGDYTIRVCDIHSGELVGGPLMGHTRAVRSVAFAPDGQTLTSGSEDRKVRLWDVKDRRPSDETLEGRSPGVAFIQVSRHEKTVTSGSEERTVRVGHVQNLMESDEQAQDHADGELVSEGGSNISSLQLQSTQFWPGHLSFDGSWIKFKGKQFLWLPPEYGSQLILNTFPTISIAHQTLVVVLDHEICFFKLPHNDPLLFSLSPAQA